MATMTTGPLGWDSSGNMGPLDSEKALAAEISMPAPGGDLEAYLQAVRRFPMLSLEREQVLGRRWRDKQDMKAAGELVLSHLRLVIRIARGYLGYGLPHADLIQEGNIGLIKAVRRFDAGRGVRLTSFALQWIKAEILDYVVRSWGPVKIATTKAQRKLFFNLRSMKRGLEPLGKADISRIAAALKTTSGDVVEMEHRLAGHDVAFEADDTEDGFGPEQYLSDPDEPSDILEDAETRRLHQSGIRKALESLDPRSRRIIESRWLREENPATLRELGAEFHLSAERIRQIEAAGLRAMRGTIEAQGCAA